VDCLRDYSFTSGTIVSAVNAAAIGELLFYQFPLDLPHGCALGELFLQVRLRGDLAQGSTYFLGSCPWDAFRGPTRGHPTPWLKIWDRFRYGRNANSQLRGRRRNASHSNHHHSAIEHCQKIRRHGSPRPAFQTGRKGVNLAQPGVIRRILASSQRTRGTGGLPRVSHCYLYDNMKGERTWRP